MGHLLQKLTGLTDAEDKPKYSEQFAKIDTKKKDVIRSYANELEHSGKMDLHEISKHITQALKGYVTDRCVQQRLEEKFKDPNQSKIESIKGRSSSAENNLEHRLDVVKKDIDKVFDVWQKQGLSVENISLISITLLPLQDNEHML
jgi:hypothetical protein